MSALHAIRASGALTAGAALAWLAAAAGTGEVTGYLYAADQAEWFRLDAGAPRGPAGERDLAGAFELYATDGLRHLRWLHERTGTGRAVALAEDPSLLPPGDPVPAEPARTRLEGASRRLLAGKVVRAGGRWATLASARYQPYDVPLDAEPGWQAWADMAEYVAADEHGNLSVADTLLLGLRAQPSARPGEGSGKGWSA